MVKSLEVKGMDIPIADLVPLQERKTSHRGFARIVSSIRSIGLVEPLCVFPENDKYTILDGYLRYLALLQLEIQLVPCLVFKNKEAYTFNRMVNKLTPIQEARMLKKSREHIDDKTIAQTLGVKSISLRAHDGLLAKLHDDVKKAIDNDKLTIICAQVLSKVKPERQVEILTEMSRINDFSPAFARAQVTHTPARFRNKVRTGMGSDPWNHETAKTELCNKLVEVQMSYDFYSGLYRSYVQDLLKLTMYVRKWITNEKLAEYFRQHHAETLELLRSIVFDSNEEKSIKRKQTKTASR